MPFTLSSLASPNPPTPTMQEGGRLLPRPALSAAARQRPTLWLLALLVSLPACVPLLQPGFFASDDGLFHLYRVAALADALRQGVIYPRWFPDFGFGYGQPVLHFYSPLSYYLAVPFLPFGPIAAVKIVVALGFVLPALAMAALARRVWGATGAVLAAAVYTYFPYHLADGLLRGALAEHVAFLWPPLIFLSLLPTEHAASAPQRQAWRWTLHALTWSGLILTHHLTALMLAPVWAIAVIFLSGPSHRGRQVLNAGLAFVVALGLTAFYWLPVIAEASAVKLGADPISTGYRQHLLPLGNLVSRSLTYVYRLAAGQPLQHRLSLLMALLLLLTVAAGFGELSRAASSRALLALWRPAAPAASSPAPSRARLFIFAVVACLLSVALLTTPALPFWQLAEPLLARLQYPWRWLSLTAFASALVIGALPGLITRRPRAQVAVLLPVLALLLFSGLAVLPYTALPRGPADVTPEQMWAEDAANGQVGATWTAEFLPVAVTEQRWALGRAPTQPQAGPAPAAIPDIVLLPRGPLAYRLLLDSPQAQTIRLHAFYFPGWQVRVDGQRVLTGASGDLGLVTAQIPAGRHVVEMIFEATLPRQVAGVLTVLTWWGGLLWLLVGGDFGEPSARALSRAAWPLRRRSLLIATILVLLPGLLWLSSALTARWQPQRLSSRVGDQALLIGADLPANARPGERVAVTLYWFNLHDTDQNYQVFVHLSDASGAVRAQHDGEPVGGFTPTTRWQPNELILDRHLITLPADLTPGAHELRAGMYRLQPLRNLPVTPGDSTELAEVRGLLPTDQDVSLGRLTVR